MYQEGPNLIPIVAVSSTLGIFLITHLGVAIWFASQLRTEVRQIRTDVTKATLAIEAFANISERLALLDQRMERAELDIRGK